MFAEGILADIYKTDFILTKEHGMVLSELDSMIPFERQIYIAMLLEYLDKKAKALTNR
jgi:hypothetical protein